MTAHARFAAGEKGSGKAPEWLKFIWECNNIDDAFFGAPENVTDYNAEVILAEIYPDAKLLHRKDETVSIFSTTDHGEQVMRRAATRLGIHVG